VLRTLGGRLLVFWRQIVTGILSCEGLIPCLLFLLLASDGWGTDPASLSPWCVFVFSGTHTDARPPSVAAVESWEIYQ
jgi:hypothetical protein